MLLAIHEAGRVGDNEPEEVSSQGGQARKTTWEPALEACRSGASERACSLWQNLVVDHALPPLAQDREQVNEQTLRARRRS